MREWKVPKDIHSLEAPLEIDKLVNKAPLHSEWKNPKAALAFTRRGLEVAIWKAMEEEKKDLTPIIKDWREVANHAEKASTALSYLLSALAGPKPSSSDELILPLLTSKTFDGEPEAVHAKAASAAKILWEAAHIAAQLTASATAQRRRLGSSRPNPGDPTFKAFALTIGEIWVALTATAPSSHEDLTANPFLRFLIAAWRSAGGTVVLKRQGDEASLFRSGAQAARKEFTPDRVRRLVSAGRALPDWT